MVEISGVAGAEESVGGEHGGCFFGLVIVAAHHRRAFYQDFVVGADFNLDAGEHSPDGAYFVIFIGETAYGGCGFRQAVAYYDGYTHGAEKFRDGRA